MSNKLEFTYINETKISRARLWQDQETVTGIFIKRQEKGKIHTLKQGT